MPKSSDAERVGDRADVGRCVRDRPALVRRRAAVAGAVVRDQPDAALRGVHGVRLVLKRAARRPVVDHNRQPVRVAALDHVQGAAVWCAHVVLHGDVSYQVESPEMSLTVLNPATEQPIAELEQAGVEETDAAVARAKAAYPAWRAVAPNDRARLLRRLATLIEEHHEELAQIESRNVGKPIAGARGEVEMVANVFHFYAGAVDKHYGETIPVAGGVDLTFREPLGVVGLIVPWNFPLNIASWKLGPRSRAATPSCSSRPS